MTPTLLILPLFIKNHMEISYTLTYCMCTEYVLIFFKFSKLVIKLHSIKISLYQT